MASSIELSKTRVAYGIEIIKSQKLSSRKLNDLSETPKLHGHQIWRSSYMLLDYFNQNPLELNQRVMDIGCGWGLSGIYCAKHFAAKTVLVDADKRVFSYVKHHEKINNVSVETVHRSFEELAQEDFVDIDIVVGSDICFWPELFRDLKRVVERALKAGTKQIILADPGRPNFMELAEYCQRYYNSELCTWVIGKKTKRQGYVLSVSLP